MSVVNVPLPVAAPPFAWPRESTAERDPVARARRGDQAAFETIVQQHHARLYRLAYRLLRHREEAEDVVQEAFVKALEALPSLREDRAFHAWLDRIAVTLCLSRLRSASRRESPAGSLSDSSWESPQSGNWEYALLVHDALADLPPHYCSLLTACYLEGRSYRELAGLAGLHMHTLKARLFRARRCLRTRLTKAFEEDARAGP